MAAEHSTSLAGQVAIVTGSGRGIGRAIALAYANAGAQVVITARSQEQIDSVRDEIGVAGGTAIAVRADVTNRADVVALVAQTLEAFGRLLRPDGVLLVFVPNGGGLRARELGTRWLALIGEKHTLALDASFFSEALPRHGIQPRFTSAEYWIGAPYPIPPITLPEVSRCPTALDGDELVVLGRRD